MMALQMVLATAQQRMAVTLRHVAIALESMLDQWAITKGPALERRAPRLWRQGQDPAQRAAWSEDLGHWQVG